MPRIGDSTKHIWAIYLGRDSIFNCPLIVYFCRTTTQIEDFQTGGNREGRKYIEFKKGKFGFDEDCLIDLGEKPYTNSRQSSPQCRRISYFLFR